MADQPTPGPDAGPPPPPAIGGVPLPPGYVLVERLGSGGFATVWLAEQGRLGRRVAVKLLGETLDDAERERRFLAECRAIGRLSGHPAVVTVHDAGTTDAGHPYLVMEHLPGGSLHDRVARHGPMPWAEVLDVGVHVADALAAAHDAGILHRDVKPANVLLDENGAPKLGDFGIARLSEGTNTATGTLVGTIPFTPPEVLSGHRPGPTADVWSLGATLHALLTGSSPFGGDRDEPPAATIARVLRSEPPPLPPAVPAPLRDLVRTTLGAEPGSRPQSAAEVAGQLQRIQADRGLPVTPARSTRTAPPTPPPSPALDATVLGMAPVVTGPPPPTPVPAPPTPVPPTQVPAPPTVVGAGSAAAGPPSGGAADAGATAVLRPHDPAGSPPGGATPPPGAGRAPGRRRGPLVAAVVVVLLLVAAGVGAALVLGGGDDDPEAATTTADEAGGTTAPDDEGGPQGAEFLKEIDTPLGAPLAVPTGTSAAPTGGWQLDGACVEEGVCSIVGVDGDLVALRGDPAGNLTLSRHAAADGAQAYSVDLGVGADAGLGRAADALVVATSDGGRRTYRAIEPGDGSERWSVQVDDSDGPYLPNPQISTDHVVLVLGNVHEYVTVAVGDGTERRDTGTVLATDEDTVYVALDGVLVARALATGEERWRAPEVVPAAPADEFPSSRYGVVFGQVLVVATAGEVVGLNRADGSIRWRQPLSDGGVTVGRPLAVSTAAGRVIVSAESGDLGLESPTGTVTWREARDRLVLDPSLDRDLLRSAQGNGIWFGEGSRLIAGWTGVRLRVIDTTTGEVVADEALPPTADRSSVAIFQTGLALLSGSQVTVHSNHDGSVLWQVEAGDATSVVAIDGGIALVGPSGIRALTRG
ncbi:MAG TPA: protein kinase [Acidimicrobiales bacterium]|nr:protein kinase [Acidimicrobiales bacterium]